MNSKVSVVIAVVVLVIFSYITYFTINNSSASVSGSSTPTQGYLKVVNDTQQLYMVTNTTESIQFNMTVYTSASSVYVYDISPLNNSSAVWVNLTSLGPDNYEQYSVHNGSTITINLSLNSSAVSLMKPFNPYELSGIYPVTIIVISSNDGVTGFGFGLAKMPLPV